MTGVMPTASLWDSWERFARGKKATGKRQWSFTRAILVIREKGFATEKGYEKEIKCRNRKKTSRCRSDVRTANRCANRISMKPHSAMCALCVPRRLTHRCISRKREGLNCSSCVSLPYRIAGLCLLFRQFRVDNCKTSSVSGEKK